MKKKKNQNCIKHKYQRQTTTIMQRDNCSFAYYINRTIMGKIAIYFLNHICRDTLFAKNKESRIVALQLDGDG